VCLTLKDNIDVAGETTMAGGVVCAGEAPALHDAPVVQRLREAGAVVLGKTNMSEFAFSGVGINPHHGTPANPADAARARVPGGSSSGAAVSVALGLAEVGIGTDTGGSIRIPAALCGLVGFKSTQARIPCTGVMELSRTLDTVGSITRSVRACLAVDAVLSQQPLPTDATELRGLRFAVPQTLMLDDVDATVAQDFARTLQRISKAGAQVVEIPFAALGDIAALSMPGGFSPIESYAAHHARLERGAHQIDPRVVARMMLGKGISAQDYLALHNRRRAWIAAAQQTLHGFDAMLCPTVPMVAPLTESFARWDNLKIVIMALLGGTAGQAVVWYTGQFYALFFLLQTLKIDPQTANLLIAGSLLIEVIFSLDGLGLMSFEAAINRDYPVVFGTLFIFTLLGLVVKLIGDLTYTLVDPRIDFASREH